MQSKIRLTLAMLISTTIFLVVLSVSTFNQLKDTELEFNERKAELIKENLDLKDANISMRQGFDQKKEIIAILEQKSEELEVRVNGFEEERAALKKEYEEQLLGLKQKSAFLEKKMENLENRSLSKHIEDVIQKEENQELKKFLAKIIYNIETIKRGGNIELDPIVVTEKESGLPEYATTEGIDRKIQGEGLVLAQKVGKVTSVDEKYSLIIFNLGRQDGVRRGGQCVILKDGKGIAEAEIISVRYRVSAAFVYEMAYGYNINNINEGDAISISE